MILTAIIVLSGLAIIFGIGLSISSRVFHVEIDPKIEKIEEILPSVNCGACGFPGCEGFAEAVVKKNVDIHGCAPGGEKVAHKIAEVMGKKATKKERKIALIKCQSWWNREYIF